MDNDGLRYGATESALRPSLPTATIQPSHAEPSSHFAEAQIHARLTNPAKQNIITSIRGSRRPVADFKSEPRPASNRNQWPASYWNAWPASSVSADWNHHSDRRGRRRGPGKPAVRPSDKASLRRIRCARSRLRSYRPSKHFIHAAIAVLGSDALNSKSVQARWRVICTGTEPETEFGSVANAREVAN